VKYLILERLGPIFEVPVIFPCAIDHDQMARRFGIGGQEGVANVVSAGFVQVSNAGVVSCYSHSTTIPDKPPRPEDDAIIQRMLDKY
jgi:hypothetical protein